MGAENGEVLQENLEVEERRRKEEHWRRILLLMVAVTVHNIPEGLAVGVGFGAIGRTKSATFESARNLALGIGIQNFPEGVAVALPLKAAGCSTAKAIWSGRASCRPPWSRPCCLHCAYPTLCPRLCCGR